MSQLDLSSKTVGKEDIKIIGYLLETERKIPDSMTSARTVARIRGLVYSLQGISFTPDFNEYHFYFANKLVEKKGFLVSHDFTSEKNEEPVSVVFVEADERLKDRVELFEENRGNSGIFENYSDIAHFTKLLSAETEKILNL